MAQQRPSRSLSGGGGRRGSDALNASVVAIGANCEADLGGAAASSSSAPAPAPKKNNKKSTWRLFALPSSVRDTLSDDFYASLAAVALFALAVAAAAAFLGPAARPPHGAAWSLVLVWAAARAATALAAATGLPSPCFQLAAGILLRNAASRSALSGLFGGLAGSDNNNARLAEGVRSAAASLIFVYGGLEIDLDILFKTGEPAKLLLSSLAEAAAIAAAAWRLFSMPPALALALGAVVKGAGPSLVVALAADVARRDDGGGGSGGGGGAAAGTPGAPATPHHQQHCGRARRTRLLKLLVGTAPLDEATSLILFSALAGIALPAGGKASSHSSSSWAAPPWAGGLVTLSLALAGAVAGALVLSATKLWSSPVLLAAAAGCVAAAVKGCLELFGHQAAGDLAVIGCGVLARALWKRGWPRPLAAVSVSKAGADDKKQIIVPLVSAAAVSRARARLAAVWFNIAAPAMLGLAGASVDLRQLDKRTASLAAAVVGIGAAARVLATTLAMRSPWQRKKTGQNDALGSRIAPVVSSFRRGGGGAVVVPFCGDEKEKRPKASSDGGQGEGGTRRKPSSSHSLSPLSWRESFFLALSFSPRSTLQVALAGVAARPVASLAAARAARAAAGGGKNGNAAAATALRSEAFGHEFHVVCLVSVFVYSAVPALLARLLAPWLLGMPRVRRGGAEASGGGGAPTAAAAKNVVSAALRRRAPSSSSSSGKDLEQGGGEFPPPPPLLRIRTTTTSTTHSSSSSSSSSESEAGESSGEDGNDDGDEEEEEQRQPEQNLDEKIFGSLTSRARRQRREALAAILENAALDAAALEELANDRDRNGASRRRLSGGAVGTPASAPATTTVSQQLRALQRKLTSSSSSPRLPPTSLVTSEEFAREVAARDAQRRAARRRAEREREMRRREREERETGSRELREIQRAEAAADARAARAPSGALDVPARPFSAD